MTSGADRHTSAFLEEAYELLTELETALLELEETPADAELVGRVFRAMHTIKGSGAMFGFDDVSAFTHEVETVFDLVREGRMTVTKGLINLTLRARDHIRVLLDASKFGDVADKGEGESIVAGLRALLPAGEKTEAGSKGTAPKTVPGESAGDVTYRIRFKPSQNILRNGTNPLLLLQELMDLGIGTVVAQTGPVPELGGMEPDELYLFWDVVLTTNRGLDAINDVFIFVSDESEITIQVIDDGGIQDADENYLLLGQILVDRGDLSVETMKEVLGRKRLFGQICVDAGILQADQVEAALIEQQHVRKVRTTRQQDTTQDTVRVPSGKLDRLVDLVGELVTVQARLSQTVAGNGRKVRDPILVSIGEEVERLTAELRDETMSIRMLPIGSTFSRFRRLVRDLSQELGKEIELETSGAETELDKTVIDRLNDPLVHLIRNSIDHGIEAPAAREATGKPRTGRIRLAASHAGANVLIRIRDDGAGIDPERVRKKAMEKGLIGSETSLSEQDMLQLIFAPGFSTAATVTSVSGRGVGMDVVKRGIEALHGTVDISSRKGEGTEITLKLPLTLAIIEALLTQVADEYYVLPLSSVEECIQLTRADVEHSHGRQITNLRGTVVPYVRLRDHFRMAEPSPDIEQIVIADVSGQKVGFVVDHVIGEHQTVIKPLGRMYQDVEGLSGATILGDGSVALIVDVTELARFAEAEQNLARV